MEHSEQHISNAILGQSSIAVPHASNGLGLPRSEPAPLFFIIFGLIYEALAVSSPQSSSTPSSHSAIVAASLRALKCLIDPRYSGKALLEPTVFKEFISLCYRMAMVENAATLVHLLEVVTVFAKHFGHLGIESVVVPYVVQISAHSFVLDSLAGTRLYPRTRSVLTVLRSVHTSYAMFDIIKALQLLVRNWLYHLSSVIDDGPI